MNGRTKNLAVAGGAVALLGIIGVNVLVAPSSPAPPLPLPAASPSTETADTEPVAGSLVDPSPAASGAETSPSISPASVPQRHSYAIGLHELQGLPPDAAAGTTFELWVTWEPPLTEEPRLERLIGDVLLERVIPGTVPEAPVTALLSVPSERTGDLIYADTFGRLSVVLPG